MRKIKIQFHSIQSRLVFVIGLGLMIVGGVIILINGVSASNLALNNAKTSGLLSAEKTAYQVKSELELGMDASQTIASSFSFVKDPGSSMVLTRDQANAMLRRVLEDNPSFLGISTGWEPNAFDNSDTDFVNAEAHDATGRFIPYWVRDEKGDISHVALVDYDKEGLGEYYLCPKRTNGECILDPYKYPIGGQEVLLTSSMVPIMNHNKFYGVVGVDTTLTYLQNMAEKMDMYDGQAELVILSSNGTVAAAGKHPDMIGELMSDFPDFFSASDIDLVKNGTEDVSQEGNNLQVVTPFQIGNSPSKWSVMFLVPMSVLTHEAMQSVIYSSLVGLGLIILGLVIIWIIIGQSISKPVKVLAASATLISRGDINVTGLEKKQLEGILAMPDEIGAIGRAFSDVVNYQSEMANVAINIAEGDLTASITPKGETDVLGHAFVKMGDSLRDAINDVARSAESVSQSSAQLAFNSQQAGQATSQIAMTIQQVASGTSQQAASISRTASSVNQMTNAIDGVARGAQAQSEDISKAVILTNQLSQEIQKVAGNAGEVVRESTNASNAARDGVSIVNETLEGMNAIKEKVDISAKKVQEMGSRSDQIGEIITTIEDIASQTNLLALNAAIEAARAGDAGKGFAVVADEVRKLAERSAVATREIGALIGGIQSTVSEAVKAMQDGSREVDMGVTKAGQAGDALKSILDAADEVKSQAELAAGATTVMAKSADELVSAVDSVSAVVEQNTAATEEMTASSTEVSQSIENIASISEENSAAVEEVSASTEEMSAQVEEVSNSAMELAEESKKLQGVVTRFKV
jgi:methyl-accepting chemotaxis protein